MYKFLWQVGPQHQLPEQTDLGQDHNQCTNPHVHWQLPRQKSTAQLSNREHRQRAKVQEKVRVRKPLRNRVNQCSDSEDLEVDFPNYHPNQPHQVPADAPQEANPPANAPVEEQQEQEPHANNPIEAPVGDAEEP